MIIFNVGDKMPKTCENCPLFDEGGLGIGAACVVGGEYTDDEIDAEPDGSLNMYYHGCLTNKPKNCPLQEITIEEG